MKFTRNELQSVRRCHECYVNANEHPNQWFSMVCGGHHPVVWAKLDTYPYWPAKLMDRNEASGTVAVHFFGDQRSATIPSINCTKYTENCPSHNLGQYKDAWNESRAVRRHVHLLLETFDLFILFSSCEHRKPKCILTN